MKPGLTDKFDSKIFADVPSSQRKKWLVPIKVVERTRHAFLSLSLSYTHAHTHEQMNWVSKLNLGQVQVH